MSRDHCDVLVVGAGPTGLTLAAQLEAFGVKVQLIDKAIDRTRESRALAIQPRTLEVLRTFGVADELIRRGNPAVQWRIHAGGRDFRAGLFDVGMDDTAFDFLLFLSQAETEAVLAEHLSARGVRVERGTTLEDFEDDDSGVTCTLRGQDGATRTVHVGWVAGCDGAHSTVRELAGIPFTGGRYAQTFVLADLSVDGLEPGTVNAHVGPGGPLLLFPLGSPAPWRLIAMRDASAAGPVTLEELQALVRRATGGRLHVADPVWMTAFRIHHRHASRYRAGRVFLAGDAAHVHSPAGAQGMNTGIQDAVNLGWKLGLVTRGLARPELLDSYDSERRPVGAFVLRFTDRAFTAATSSRLLVQAIRTHVVPRLLPLALRMRPGRRAVFRTVSQLGIRYRGSPAVATGAGHHDRRGSGPRPGDRLPDGRIILGGRPAWLHEAMTEAAFHLLLCGPVRAWDDADVGALHSRFGDLLTMHRLDAPHGPGVIVDPGGRLLRRLRVKGNSHLVIRPDGHIGYRADDTDLSGAALYLAQWLIRP